MRVIGVDLFNTTEYMHGKNPMALMLASSMVHLGKMAHYLMDCDWVISTVLFCVWFYMHCPDLHVLQSLAPPYIEIEEQKYKVGCVVTNFVLPSHLWTCGCVCLPGIAQTE